MARTLEMKHSSSRSRSAGLFLERYPSRSRGTNCRDVEAIPRHRRGISGLPPRRAVRGRGLDCFVIDKNTHLVPAGDWAVNHKGDGRKGI